MGALTSESNLGCPSLEENPEVAEMAEVFILKNPNNTSFIKEQNEDITLNGCFRKANENPIPLTSEYPESYCVGKGLLYREVLKAPHRGEGLHKQLRVPVKYRDKILEEAHRDVFEAHMGVCGGKRHTD